MMFKVKIFRNILLMFLMTCFLSSGVAIARSDKEATMGMHNSSNIYRVEVTKDTAEPNAILTFSQNTAIKYPYENYTTWANNTIQSYESGWVIYDNTSAGVKHTLPATAAGLQFTLVAKRSNVTTLDTVGTGDTIRYSPTPVAQIDAGDSLIAQGTSGDSAITVFCPVAGTWVVTSVSGTWEDNGTN